MMSAAIGCALVIGTVSVAFSSSMVIEQEKNSYLRSLSASVGIIDAALNDAEYLMDIIMTDGEIQSSLRMSFPYLRTKYSADLRVSSRLNSLTMYTDNISSASVIGINGLLSNSQSYTFSKTDYTGDDWFTSHLSSIKPRWEYCKSKSPFLKSVINQNHALLTCAVKDLSNGRVIGIAVVELHSSSYSNMFKNDHQSTSILVNEKGELLCTLPEGANAPKGAPNIDFSSVEDTTIIDEPASVHFIAPLSNGWFIVQTYGNRAVVQNGMLIAFVIICSVVIISIVIIIISHAASIQLTKRLTVMTNQVSMLERGDFSIKMDTSGRDEITVLSQHFNSMVDHTNELMDTIRSDQQKLHDAEMRTLQAQIKPHFLYNTLEAIAWLARFKRNDDVVSITMALTTYFRRSLNSGSDFISLKDELEHAQSYVTIQLYRYNNSFKYEVSADGETEGVLSSTVIPKLILQPLIENSLYHGVKTKEDDGLIRVRLFRKGELLMISVSDNGSGMDKETLDMLSNIEADGESGRIGYGLKNVDRRIRMFFGEKYGLSFKSTLGVGTVVTIAMPWNGKAEEKKT